MLRRGQEWGGGSEEQSSFSSRFQPPARDFEGAGEGLAAYIPPPEVTSSFSSPTANTGPERWGVPKRQRAPRRALPLGGPEDGGAAEELAGGVWLHPPPLHCLPPGVGGALHHQGRAGTWGGWAGGGHGDPWSCWSRTGRCCGGMRWAGGVWGATERIVHRLPCWGAGGCPHPWVAPGWRSPRRNGALSEPRGGSVSGDVPESFWRGARLSAGTERAPQLPAAPASLGTAGKGTSEPLRPGRGLAQQDVA